jgi:hypothetical protein
MVGFSSQCHTADNLAKIKCDESKPNCVKCSSTGRTCDGYASSPSTKRRSQIVLASSDQASTPKQGLPLFSTTASSGEMRALEYFCVKMATNLGMHFDADFWRRLIIPASMAEPALRHAMVAVGIFAEQLESYGVDRITLAHTQAATPRSTPTLAHVRRRGSHNGDFTALSNYHKSIGLLTKPVSPTAQTTDVILLACILFVCVELLRGDDVAAFRHFKGGMTIIVELFSRKQSITNSRLMVDRVRSVILPAFTRLEMLSALFGNAASWPYPVAIADSVPGMFSCIGDARDSMVHLMNLALRLVQTMQLLEYVPFAIPVSAYDEQETLLRYIQLWRSRFSLFQASRAQSLAVDDLYAANVLEIQCTVAYTWVSTLMTPYQCAHDAHIPAYRAAVVLAEQIYGTGSMRIQHARQSNTFLLEVEIVGPLYWICVKCRHPVVRRRAITVLRSMHRREGMWDSDIAAIVADCVVAAEEASLDIQGLPTEEVRVHGTPFAFEEDVGPFGLSVTLRSKPFGVYGDWSVWQEHVSMEVE